MEVSSKMVENRWLDWVLPLIIFAGPPRVVGLARRFTCACQLSAPNQVGSPQNHTQSNKKILHKGGLFCWLGWLDSNQRMTIPKTVALPLGDTPNWVLN